MKTRIQLIVLFLTFFMLASLADNEKLQGQSASKKVVINTSTSMLGLTSSLVSEYEKVSPNLKFSMNEIPDSPSLNLQAGNLSFLNEGQLSAISRQQVWHTLIGRNVVIPVLSSKNPYLGELLQRGISLDKLKGVLQEPEKWGKLVGGIQSEPVHVYTLKDEAVSSILKGWLGEKQPQFDQINSMELNALIQAVQNDPLAIGFCKLTQVSDIETGGFINGLNLFPIDKNSNGKIDYMENIYDNMQSLTRGIWIGKYPHELTTSLFVVAREKPQNESELAFLKWIVTNGQDQLANNGFSSLNYNEQLAQLAKFDDPQMYTALPTEKANSLMSALLLALVVIVLGGVCVEFVFRAFARKSNKAANVIVESVKAFTEDVVDVPKGLYFDKSHSWAFMRKNGLVKVGIDDFLQHVTGKITKVEMKEQGVKIRKGDRLCSIFRKGKVLHIYSPVTGTILEANEKLKTNAALLNTDPYSGGWIYVIEPVNWELEIQYLLIADRFRANLKGEFQRLKDFLESTMKSLSPDFAYAVLQDGGSFVDHPLAELGPDVWDDFQTKFIDAAK